MTKMVAETAGRHPAPPVLLRALPAHQDAARGGSRARRSRAQPRRVTFGVGVIVGLYGDDADESEAWRVGTALPLQPRLLRSTPAYRVVLDAHGWGELQDELNRLTKQGRWGDIGDVWDDEMVHTLSVQGTPSEAAAEIKSRFGGLADRIHISLHGAPQPLVAELFAALKG